ncbi:MAG: RNB domain-containing ribonuclease [Acidimicrobiales bacterium]
MPRIVIRAPKTFERAFDQIRGELDVPSGFSDAVLAEAQTAAPPEAERLDARHLPFVAVDPPGATDLDQAFMAERRGDGYRVFYAIADVGAFLVPGGAIDTEARKRGATLYSPDTRTPLHPEIISEDRASLLAGTEKPALLWTIDLDDAGEPIEWGLQRATVTVDEAITYTEAQRRIDGRSDDRMLLLAEIGSLRQDREAERGGVSLNLPAQEIVERDGNYSLEFDQSLPVEGWNAQISLLTGIVAGRTMFDAKVGILRTLPPPFEDAVTQLRQTARFLKLDWQDNVSYPDFVRNLEPNNARCNAFLIQAARSFRGAGYYGFNGEVPKYPEHGAIASVYSHVTAPLRRLVDRFGNEVLLALYAGSRPPAWALEALEELPKLMGQSRQRESALERAMLDMTEALVLEHSIGEVFDGFVVSIDQKRNRAGIQIAEPAIVSHIPAKGRKLAEDLKLMVDSVDVTDRRVKFTVLDS